MDLVLDAQRMIMGNFVDKPDAQKLAKGAIDGMLESLDDPYAEYISADDAADFEKSMTGSFSGIGCQIDSKDGWLYVVSPLEDSPAFNAGIIAGDRITAVDGKTTQNVSVDKCIKMITGPEGTPVKVDIQRAGQDMPFTLHRAKIISKSVRGFQRLPDGSGHWNHLIDPETKTAYIRMSQFTPTAPHEMLEALDQAAAAAGVAPDKLGGLILDLRYNPGGLMDAAIEIVDMFIDEGRIMSTKGRNTPEVVYNAEKSANTPQYPIAILVNGNSASASEIVSGSLSENLAKSGRVVVIGTRTYGKGLVQTVANLPHDPRASIKFTAQRYYLPGEKGIQRIDGATEWGVDPSPGFFMPLTDVETTAWLLKRRDWDVLLKDGKSLPPGMEPVPALADQHWADPTWIESASKDRQLAGALKSIESKITTGQWLKLNDEPNEHGHILMAELKKIESSNKFLARQLIHNEKRLEALESVAASGKPKKKIPDFWPDTLDLTGGLVEVRDKDGHIIADLKITGPNLERLLAYADVENQKKDDTTAAAAKPPEEKPKQ